MLTVNDPAEPGIRINRFLASCGICSRRDADRLVEAGRVLIDGRPAKAGDRVSAGAQVLVDGREAIPQQETVVYAYYKPRGVVCTERDAHASRTVMTELAGRLPGRLTYIGRLDRDSEGLLLLTNDGALKQLLESAKNGTEKEYLVTTDRPLTPEAKKRMEAGVPLTDLGITTKPCRILPAEGGADAGDDGRSRFRIILTEGKNRQIRRMCESEGLRVTRLIRVREAGVTLGDMKPGDLRALSATEIEHL
ncbi:MAG: rRNA pseudouridine synthase [Lachnospiraceae bacterium]|nr:rRNA pseudouridine synthase [Lachnospiraceae bacterium]